MEKVHLCPTCDSTDSCDWYNAAPGVGMYECEKYVEKLDFSKHICDVCKTVDKKCPRGLKRDDRDVVVIQCSFFDEYKDSVVVAPTNFSSRLMPNLKVLKSKENVSSSKSVGVIYFDDGSFKEIERGFSSRFMPNVKFSIIGFEHDLLDANIQGYNWEYKYWFTDADGNLHPSPQLDYTALYFWKKIQLPEVSIHEAVPEILDGTGMKYNKETDELIPDDVPFYRYEGTDEILRDIKENLDESTSKEPQVVYASVRDSFDSDDLPIYDIECRFDDGQKFAAIQVHGEYPCLASSLVDFLNRCDKKLSYDSHQNLSNDLGKNPLITDMVKKASDVWAESKVGLDDIAKEYYDWINLQDGIGQTSTSFDDKKEGNTDFIKFDGDKTRYDLVCPYAYEDLAKVMTFGAKKYAPGNWKLGDIYRYISALERHLSEVKKGLDSDDVDLFIDFDSGLQHGAALLFNAQAVHYFIRTRFLKDIGDKSES